jgi:hypothetical protein
MTWWSSILLGLAILGIALLIQALVVRLAEHRRTEDQA